MDNWIPITTNTLNEASIAALITSCSTLAKGSGQADRAPGLIQGRVDEIRAAVASHRTNGWDEDETKIPRSLKRLATTLIVADLKSVVGIELTSSEEKELDRADRKLRDVAAGKLLVNRPDDPVEAEVQGGSATETIAEGNSGNSREDTKGL